MTNPQEQQWSAISSRMLERINTLAEHLAIQLPDGLSVVKPSLETPSDSRMIEASTGVADSAGNLLIGVYFIIDDPEDAPANFRALLMIDAAQGSTPICTIGRTDETTDDPDRLLELVNEIDLDVALARIGQALENESVLNLFRELGGAWPAKEASASRMIP